MHAFDCTAPYPSGKGAVCKTAMHQFDSDWRLFIDIRIVLYRFYRSKPVTLNFHCRDFPVRAKSDKYSYPIFVPAEHCSCRIPYNRVFCSRGLTLPQKLFISEAAVSDKTFYRSLYESAAFFRFYSVHDFYAAFDRTSRTETRSIGKTE